MGQPSTSRTPRRGSGRTARVTTSERQRRYSARPAAVLVVVLAGLIALFGANSAWSNEPLDVPAPTVEVTQAPDVALASTVPPATQPLQPTSTPLPSPTPTTEPTPEPTIAPTPVETERPSAPPTGLEGQSYVYSRGESGRKEVAFTFDAGEGPGHVTEILDILDSYGVKGSFGITGEWAEANPDLLRRIVDDGHMVINHTYDHASWTGESMGTAPLTHEQQLDEVSRTEQIILNLTGYDTKPFFRFPYNDYDKSNLETLKEAGYDYTLFWTCDTLAWNGTTAAEIEQMCSPDDPEHGGPGAVILMHVVQDQDLAALPALIGAYQAEGYDVVTMDQMVQP